MTSTWYLYLFICLFTFLLYVSPSCCECAVFLFMFSSDEVIFKFDNVFWASRSVSGTLGIDNFKFGGSTRPIDNLNLIGKEKRLGGFFARASRA